MRIGTLHEGQALVVHHVFRPDNSAEELEVGALLPGHATAIGKVLLAHNPYATEALIDSGLEAITANTVTDPGPLREAQVRDRGWASDVEELVAGEVSLAAPIQDRRGVTVGAIGISGPIERLCDGSGPRSELISPCARRPGRSRGTWARSRGEGL